MAEAMMITVDDRAVQKTLFDLNVLLSPIGMSSFLSSVMGPYLSKRAKERFQGEGDDVVGKWQALETSTIQMRQEQGFAAGPINRRTGELENWVVSGGWDAYPSGFGASMKYPRNQPTGELRKKVETAQKGRTAIPVTPKRPVLGVNENDLLFFQAALQLTIEGAM